MAPPLRLPPAGFAEPRGRPFGVKRDIAILIYSRGRESLLARLIDDLDRFYMPALEAGGLSACAFIYAQNYAPAYLEGLRRRHAAAIRDGRLILCEARQAHSCIGEVFVAAAEALHQQLDYRLAMLMDDDSLYRPDRQVDANLRDVARQFLAAGTAPFPSSSARRAWWNTGPSSIRTGRSCPSRRR